MPSAIPHRGVSDPIVDKTMCQMTSDFKRHTALPILGFYHPRASQQREQRYQQNRKTYKKKVSLKNIITLNGTISNPDYRWLPIER